MKAEADETPTCGECHNRESVRLARGDEIYPHRPDLAQLLFYRCACGAYVGVHKGTTKPKGAPAAHETRQARIRAHAAFDPLWRRAAARDGINLNHARARGYKWLAAQLGIERKECHIGMMSAHDADRVTALCSRYQPL